MDKKLLRNLLYISLVLIIIGGLVANLTQTNFGKVTVKDVRFAAPNGRMYSALLYIPDGVTAEAPAPGILAIHGYINTRETQDGFAIEFARRGYVVLALDQSGHGYSEGPAFADGFGGIEGLRYLKSLSIVDQDNVGLEGHSMGGWASVIAAATFRMLTSRWFWRARPPEPMARPMAHLNFRATWRWSLASGMSSRRLCG